MTRRGLGDDNLLMLVARRGWRTTSLALLLLAASASLYLRVWLGRPGDGPPWLGWVTGLYCVTMFVLSRQWRSRLVWGALAILTQASFVQQIAVGLVDPVRLRGAVEAAAALTAVVTLWIVSRYRGDPETPVLKSPASTQSSPDDAEVKS